MTSLVAWPYVILLFAHHGNTMRREYKTVVDLAGGAWQLQKWGGLLRDQQPSISRSIDGVANDKLMLAGLSATDACTLKSGKACGPTTTGTRVTRGSGYCCVCPQGSAWNDLTKECVCAVGVEANVPRSLPDKTTRECPASPDEAFLATMPSTNKIGKLRQVVSTIRSYCEGCQTLEGLRDHYRNNRLLLGLGPDLAISAQDFTIAKFSLKMMIQETPEGLQLVIDKKSEFGVVLSKVTIVGDPSGYGKRALTGITLNFDKITAHGIIYGEEFVANIEKYPGSLGLHANMAIKFYGDRWDALLSKVAGTNLVNNIVQWQVAKVFAKLSTIAARLLRATSLEGPLRQAFQGRNPYPINLEISGSEKAGKLHLAIDKFTAGTPEAVEDPARSADAVIPQGMKLDLKVIGGELQVSAYTQATAVLRNLLEQVTTQANQAMLTATPNQGTTTTKTTVASCKDQRKPSILRGAMSSAWSLASNIFWNSSEKESSTLEHERFALRRWASWNENRYGVMQRGDGTALWMPSIKGISMKLWGEMTLVVNPEQSPTGAAIFEGELHLLKVKLIGLKLEEFQYDVGDNFQSGDWVQRGPGDLDIKLENTQANVKVTTTPGGGAWACVEILNLNITIGGEKYKGTWKGWALNMFAKKARTYIPGFAERILESVVGSVVEKALPATKNVLKTVSVKFTQYKEGNQGEMMGVGVFLDFTSDWTKLNDAVVHMQAKPPQNLFVDLDKMNETGFKRNGIGWDFVRQWIGDPPRGTRERLPIAPGEWLDGGYHFAMDSIIEELSLEGGAVLFDPSAVPVDFNGKILLNLDPVLRPMLGGAGAWDHGHFLSTGASGVRVMENDDSKGNVAMHEDVSMFSKFFSSKSSYYEAVLSCGFFYLLEIDKGKDRFRLRERSRPVPRWKARFDILNLERTNFNMSSLSSEGPGLVRGERPCAAQTGGLANDVLYVGSETRGGKQFSICLQKGSKLQEAIEWEMTKTLIIAGLITGEDFNRGAAWGPLGTPMKVGLPGDGFTYIGQGQAQVQAACASELESCARFLPCQGVASPFGGSQSTCMFLSHRDVRQMRKEKSRPFLYKEWFIGPPLDWI